MTNRELAALITARTTNLRDYFDARVTVMEDRFDAKLSAMQACIYGNFSPWRAIGSNRAATSCASATPRAQAKVLGERR